MTEVLETKADSGRWHLVQFRELDSLLQGATPADGRDVQHTVPELDEGPTGGEGAGGGAGRGDQPGLPGTSLHVQLSHLSLHPLRANISASEAGTS